MRRTALALVVACMLILAISACRRGPSSELRAAALELIETQIEEGGEEGDHVDSVSFAERPRDEDAPWAFQAEVLDANGNRVGTVKGRYERGMLIAERPEWDREPHDAEE